MHIIVSEYKKIGILRDTNSILLKLKLGPFLERRTYLTVLQGRLNIE